MKYFVKIENGQPVSGVITEQNLFQAFPHFANNGVSSEFAIVKKATETAPETPPYHNWAGTKVVMVDGAWVEQHVFEPMTEAEREATKAAAKYWHEKTGLKSWIWNENDCSFYPPVPQPQDGKTYEWNESSLSWVEANPEG